MWEQLTDEQLDAEIIAAEARIDAAQHTRASLVRERARRVRQAHAVDTRHDFVPVAGHPDDDECTHRQDGCDLLRGTARCAHAGSAGWRTR